MGDGLCEEDDEVIALRAQFGDDLMSSSIWMMMNWMLFGATVMARSELFLE